MKKNQNTPSLSEPFGLWPSPLSAADLARGKRRLGDLHLDGDAVYWTETRPERNGSAVLCRQPVGGEMEILSPPEFNVKARVQVYGGGAFALGSTGIRMTSGEDRQIYFLNPENGEIRAVTNQAEAAFCDMVDCESTPVLFAVRERPDVASHYPVSELVSISKKNPALITAVVSGNDFYASPALSPDGKKLAWLCWDHPNMPWDGCQLWLADVNLDGRLSNASQIAGGSRESVFQPQWQDNQNLVYVSDRSGWWNLYRFDGESHLALAPQSAEFGLPQWVFGLSTFGIDRDGTIACAFCRNGLWHLGILDGGGGKLRSCELPFTFIQQVRIRNGRVAFVGAAPETARAVFVYDLTQNRLYPCGEKSDPPLAQPFISAGQSIEVASEGGLTVQAFFYPPVNPEVTGPAGQLPPLIVMGHGGPTDANDNGLTLKIQFWTTRGFAVADVNYRGSSGRGRAFRESLNGKWGRAEVEDCLAVARHLVSEGAVDEKNLFISGSSAFGYTVLCALTFHDLFKGGASYYGISDQLALAEQTHKFEAFYSHSLIAPLPEGRESYRACSPIYHRQKLRRPIIFFQGLKDPVVAPVQAEKMVAAMRENGTPVAYLTFPEEGHGFGDEAAIRRAIEAEYSFYLQLMELPLPADLPAVLKTNSKNQRIS